MFDQPLQGGVRELAILEAVASTLHGSVDLPQALSRTLALVADLLDLQTGWVWLLDPATDQFYLAASQNLPPYLQEPVRMSGRWCLCTDLFRRGELTPTNVDMLECTRLRPAVEDNAADATLGLRFHASLPLSFGGRRLGIINVAGPLTVGVKMISDARPVKSSFSARMSPFGAKMCMNGSAAAL